MISPTPIPEMQIRQRRTADGLTVFNTSADISDINDMTCIAAQHSPCSLDSLAEMYLRAKMEHQVADTIEGGTGSKRR
jgi:hypothetical protein